MDYRILGPLEANDGDRPLVLGDEKQRALQAVLLFHAREVVSADRLIDVLWGERSPRGAVSALQTHISRLRQALDSDEAGVGGVDGGPSETASEGVLVTRGSGLVEELRHDPSRRVQQLEAAILARDPSLGLQTSGGTHPERRHDRRFWGGEGQGPNMPGTAGDEGVNPGSTDVGTDVGTPVSEGRAGGLSTFLLADIRGYSSFAASRGDEAAAALADRFAATAHRVISQFEGVDIGNRGDEVVAAFESPRRAIRAAVAFEQALLDATREDPSLPMPAGIGLDVGEAVVVADGWRANAINVAARLCSIAKAGEILATREVTHLAQAIDGIRYVPQPPVRLKGIPRRWLRCGWWPMRAIRPRALLDSA
jgi:class 3 adenylate cyclase